MKVSLRYTLDDGSVHDTKKAALAHLDKSTGNAAISLAEALAHKKATEIAVIMAHEGATLAARFVDAERYQARVEKEIKGYFIEESEE